MASRRKLLPGAGLALFIAAGGNSASAVAGQQPGSSDPFAGRWEGRLEGHGTAVITRIAEGYSVVLEVETSPPPGSRFLPCMGGIEGKAKVEGAQLVLTQTQNGATCRIIMRRSDGSLLVEVADFGCRSYHGLSCGFSGTLQRADAAPIPLR